MCTESDRLGSRLQGRLRTVEGAQRGPEEGRLRPRRTVGVSRDRHRVRRGPVGADRTVTLRLSAEGSYGTASIGPSTGRLRPSSDDGWRIRTSRGRTRRLRDSRRTVDGAVVGPHRTVEEPHRTAPWLSRYRLRRCLRGRLRDRRRGRIRAMESRRMVRVFHTAKRVFQ
jgi:hypothetical protein